MEGLPGPSNINVEPYKRATPQADRPGPKAWFSRALHVIDADATDQQLSLRSRHLYAGSELFPPL